MFTRFSQNLEFSAWCTSHTFYIPGKKFLKWNGTFVSVCWMSSSGAPLQVLKEKMDWPYLISVHLVERSLHDWEVSDCTGLPFSFSKHKDSPDICNLIRICEPHHAKTELKTLLLTYSTYQKKHWLGWCHTKRRVGWYQPSQAFFWCDIYILKGSIGWASVSQPFFWYDTRPANPSFWNDNQKDLFFA